MQIKKHNGGLKITVPAREMKDFALLLDYAIIYSVPGSVTREMAIALSREYVGSHVYIDSPDNICPECGTAAAHCDATCRGCKRKITFVPF
ncbi:MAG: hypothetical protein P1P89_22220 [Desulfobacterales bacterium]|nr:hypothetical protein [Desulfobacterales bacterium]